MFTYSYIAYEPLLGHILGRDWESRVKYNLLTASSSK